MSNHPLGAVLSRLRTVLGPAEAETTDRELAPTLRRGPRRRPRSGSWCGGMGRWCLACAARILGDAHAAEDAFQATFLVLVRRARAVPWRESLGGWLHGTARRVALRAKASGRRRRLDSAATGGGRRPLADPTRPRRRRRGSCAACWIRSFRDFPPSTGRRWCCAIWRARRTNRPRASWAGRKARWPSG